MKDGDVGGSPVRDLRLFARGLLDPRPQPALTRDILETIQRLAAVLAVLPSLVATVLAFQYLPHASTLAWLLVLGPVIYLVVLVGVRLTLGFAVAVLEFLEGLAPLPAAVGALVVGVNDLRSEISMLRAGVAHLCEEVAPLGTVVTSLNAQVSLLTSSIDSVQFWRVPTKWRRVLGQGDNGDDYSNTPTSNVDS